jgi:AbrB family looped-hinge helix DNA binding protein
MNAIVEIDKAGRIVIPKRIREELHLKPGSRLRIESSSERLVLEQDFAEPRLEMRDGVLVIVGGGPTLTAADVNDAMSQGYEERQKRIMEGSGLE